MKQKVTKKLSLGKATISNLIEKEMNNAKGGATYTTCVTLLRDQCVSLHPDYCAPTRYPGC
ncbi:MAG TPA: class I lanthipeptide [Candidatus Deferrimicrobium sp.]|nr:class I lanthipeptide [Candidatus Kapabacteria bacterium]HLP57745.1 class I lanthipeptide [Candidatus Deferrimicrobium sp.]